MKLKHRFYLALFIIVWGALMYNFVVPYYTAIVTSLGFGMGLHIIGLVICGSLASAVEICGNKLHSILIASIFGGTLFPFLGILMGVIFAIYYICNYGYKAIKAFETFLDKLEDKYDK